MKFRFSLKFMLASWIILILIVAGLFYGAYSRLKPETIIALMSEQAERNYPGSKLSVGQVTYRLSVDFNLKLADVKLMRDSKFLARIGEVEFKIPWWILILNRGNAQINLNDLDVYVDPESTVSPEPTAASPAPDLNSHEDKKVQVVLPDYLVGAKYTLRAKNISLRDPRNGRSYVKLSKLLVREFQYGKNSAFELNIPVQISHRNQLYNSQLWLFGDLTPDPTLWRLNYRGEFRTDANDKFQVDGLIIDGKATFKPSMLDVTSEINLLMEKESIGKGNLIANNSEFAIVMYFNKFPLNYLNLIDDELRNPYLPKLEGHAEGPLRLTKKRGQDIAFLSAKLTFDGNMNLGPQYAVTGKWQLSFEDNRWESSFISPKSEVSFFRRSFVDLKRGKISQFTEEIGFTGMDMNAVADPIKPFGEFMRTEGPYYTTTLSFRKCLDGNRIIDGSFRYGISPDQKFYIGELSDSIDKFSIQYQEKLPFRNILIEAHQFNWLPGFKFLSPFFGAQGGVLDGKVEGKWTEDWAFGQWLMAFRVQGLKTATGSWMNLLQKIQTVFTLESLSPPEQLWNFSVRNRTLEVNSFVLEGPDPAKISGALNETKPVLVLSYPKNKRWKPVRKDVTSLTWQKEP